MFIGIDNLNINVFWAAETKIRKRVKQLEKRMDEKNGGKGIFLYILFISHILYILNYLSILFGSKNKTHCV